MKTVGIIAEYNPFHNGHKYHIQASKETCGAEYAVCVMSGSFVQRGEPAIYDKWSRAKMAVMNGADLVLELPVVYSCQPAEIFALGGIKLLNGLGIVDYLCFGSELGHTDTLCRLSELLSTEPDDFKLHLKKHLERGVSYPKAISSALSSFLGDSESNYIDDILKSPNNILGIEYIKSLMLYKSNIKPVAVKRIVSEYNDMHIKTDIASATAIRNEIRREGLNENVRMALPQSTIDIIEEGKASEKNPVVLEDFSDILLYKLRTMEISEFRKYLNVREGIEYRLKKYASCCTSCEELIEAVKTKRYTRTYIQRLLCHIMLGINRNDVVTAKNIHCPAYIRILAFNDKGKLLLKSIKEKTSYTIITKAADFRSSNPAVKRIFELDILSTDIYSLGFKSGTFRKAGSDFMTSTYYSRT